MWARFTERARAAVWGAQDEAEALGLWFVGAEHLFLALLGDPESVACRILKHLGADLGALREEVVGMLVKPQGERQPDLQLTPGGKRVIDEAYGSARALDNNYIGTEHLLLGIIREGGSPAAMALEKAGITRAAVMERLEAMRDP